jgi:predicted nucleotidyltransferase
MAVKPGIEDIGKVLRTMVQNLHQKFKEQLVSVVIYGSYARGTATSGSDIDLLVVVRALPGDWQSIHRLEDEWMLRGRRLGKRFQVTLATPEDVLNSVECVAPMILEIYNAHRIIFDENDFFKGCMLNMAHIIKERGIRMRKPGVWEVPERVTSP